MVIGNRTLSKSVVESSSLSWGAGAFSLIGKIPDCDSGVDGIVTRIAPEYGETNTLPK